MLGRLLPLLPLLLSGCAARRSGDAVASIDFQFPAGENGLNRLVEGRPTARAMKNAMAHPQPRWQAFWVPGIVDPAWLDRDTLDEDAWRLEIWYANQGYFDARVLGWEVVPTGAKRKRIQKVRVRGIVDEGEPSRVRTIDIAGIERLQRPLQSRIRALIGAGGELAPGDVYTYEAWQEALGAVRGLLAERSYAHARVDGDVAAYPDEHAVDVTLTVVTGPPTKFGPVTIEGLAKVPEAVVRDQFEVEPGRPFTPRALEDTRAKLYALRVFGVVDVIPDLSDPAATVVPVHIRVTEAKARELRLGPIVEIDPGQASVSLAGSWTDNNVAGRLWRMQQDAKVGAGVIIDSVPALADVRPDDIEPLVDVKGVVELPHLFGLDLSLLNEGRVEVGLEPGYRYFKPSFSPSLVYTGFETLRPSIGYRLAYTDYFDLTIDLADIEGSAVGADITDPYLLSLLEQRLVYDGRNDPLNTTRGWYWSVSLAEAGGPFGGNYTFLRSTAEVRAYRGIVDLFGWDPNIVFAGRLGGGLIWPYGGGDEAAVPLAERLYLGGSTSVRGWGANRLGPYVCVPEAAEDGKPIDEGVDCLLNLPSQVPVGGELQLYGNLEARFGLPLDLVGALFVDVGRVWDRPERFAIQELQWSVGAGVRYPTPVGPIRLDIGVPLGDLPYFAAQPNWTLHLALAEAF